MPFSFVVYTYKLKVPELRYGMKAVSIFSKNGLEINNS